VVVTLAPGQRALLILTSRGPLLIAEDGDVREALQRHLLILLARLPSQR
jgi:hypothetical protein